MISFRKTILFVTLNGQGCINPTLAIAQVLKSQGHRVIFVIEKPFEGKLKQYGIEEEILESRIDPSKLAKDDEEYWPKFTAKHCAGFRKPPIGVLEHFFIPGKLVMVEIEMAKEEQYKEIIERVKPDLIAVDMYFCSPSLTNSGIPWVRIVSTNPLYVMEEDSTPPGMSGLPSSGSNIEEEWKTFQAKKRELFAPLWNKFNDWVVSLNAPQLPPNPLLHPDSPYANLYMQPKEIDLYDNPSMPLRPNFHRFDSFVRETSETFELPENLKNKEGKLVYISMGTIGSADISLMSRLVEILKDSPHGFIVSKGVLGDKYELPENMWGRNSLPQTKVIPLVDLVLTHGGNNTICETFHFGKPMIVFPLFCDQFDNAERVKEKGFGMRLNAFDCSRQELLDAVEKLLNDKNLAIKMSQIGERIRSSKSNERAADLIMKQI